MSATAISRRALLQGASAMIPTAAIATPEPDAWQADFAAARRLDPRLMALDTPPLEGFAPTDAPLTGHWPERLRGVLYRNGPARHELFGARTHHLFDGDGFIQRWQFGPDGVRHRGRYVETAKFKAENAAGQALESGFGTARRPPASPDAINVANTSLIALDSRLLALWEGGSATALDPADLATLGPVTWSHETAGLPFSAHPQRDRDGSLWNIGPLGYLGKLLIWHVSPTGTLLSAQLLDMPIRSMVHAFVLTARHLVIPLPPFVHDPARAAPGVSYYDSHRFAPELGTPVMILPKDDPGRMRVVMLPAGFVFHYSNAYEDPNGDITFDASWYDSAEDVMPGFRAIMRGQPEPGRPAHMVLIRIPAGATEARLEQRDVACEFPVIDPRHEGIAHRLVFALGPRPDDHGVLGLSRLLRHDLHSGATAQFDYGFGVIAEEHRFIPDPSRAEEGAGWLIGTSLDWRNSQTRLAVFDAAHLEDGPLAMAHLPHATPIGFHGCVITPT